MELSAPELLTEHHDLTSFDCGNAVLDDWLRTFALTNQRHGFTRVLVVHEAMRVAGFYGLAPTAVPPALLTRSMRTGRPPDPIPCILLGQLAVAEEFAGQGLGTALMRNALRRCVAAAEIIGGRAVVVRAVDTAAERYWQKCGFKPSRSDGSALARSIDDVRRWLAGQWVN